MHKWQLYEAKNKLSNLIGKAVEGEAQCITRKGTEAVIVISMAEYQKLQKQKMSLGEFLLKIPKVDELEIQRAVGQAREIDWK